MAVVYASSDLVQNAANARSLGDPTFQSRPTRPIATRSGGNQNGRFEIGD